MVIPLLPFADEKPRLGEVKQIKQAMESSSVQRVKGKKEKEDLVSICTSSCYVKNDVSIIDSLNCVDGVIHMNSSDSCLLGHCRAILFS